MFLNLWVKYGSLQTINGVECLDTYRIDGDDVGQHKMSNHLRQSDMWEQTQSPDVARVDLWFDLKKLVEIDDAGVQAWIADMQNRATTLPYDELRYEIVDHAVVSHGFYNGGALVNDAFYDTLSSYIAQKKLFDLENTIGFAGDLSYANPMDAATLNALIAGTANYSAGFVFDVDEVEDAVREYMINNTLGTNILDGLVTDGVIVGDTLVSGGYTYYLPLDTAKKMNGFAFIELVTKTLDFKVKKEGGFWNFLKRFAKLILAGIAVFYQQYWLAASLLTGFIADISGIKALQIISQVIGIFEGDFTSLLNLGASEAVNLLISVYSVYIELQYSPDTESIEEDNNASTQKMFYRAPYSAYNDIYCYARLIAVRTTDEY